MFVIAVRKRRGMEASASATSCSNCFRSTWFLPGRAAPLSRNDGTVEVARIPHNALLAERLGTADAPPVEDQRIGSARPSLFGKRVAQLLLGHDRVVRFGDADPVRHAEHMPID